MSHSYRVNDLYPAIQGEGYLTGTPMALVRLQGCPVGCPWCDTRETWEADPARLVTPAEAFAARRTDTWAEMRPLALAAACRERCPALSWVMLTGGEPLLQQPLSPLLQALEAKGFDVQVETSGTAPLGDAVPSWLTVSPKVGMSGGRVIVPEVVRSANELKWVVGRQEHVADLVAFLDRHPIRSHALIWLQPMSLSGAATAVCVRACLEHGWNLSVQVNRLVNLP